MPPAAPPILPGFMPRRHFCPRKASACRRPIADCAANSPERVKDEPRITELQRAFLGRAYALKEIADYETGPGSHVSHEQAARAIEEARGFVAAVAALIPEETAP